MNVKKKIEEILNIKLSNAELYLFGSAVYSNEYADIDLAVIYDKTKISCDEIIEYRKKVKSKISNELICKCDVILLSKEENIETNFLKNAKCELIEII